MLSERVKLLVVTGINQLADYLLKNCHLASYCVTISYREMSDNKFLVTCSVCVCNYNDESRKQKYLPCLHSFCQSCLTVSEKRNKLSIFKKSINSDILVLITVHIQQVKQFGRIKCPICRCEVRLLSGDVSTLPDTYFGCLREMEKKMKEIQLKEKEKARKIEEMKQEQEEMKRKIAQQSGKMLQDSHPS